MSRTGFVSDERFLKHKTGAGHPERPERLQAVVAHLDDCGLLRELSRIEPEPADLAWIQHIHPASYVEAVRGACRPGLNFLDADTIVCEDSYEVARLAVGGALAACDAVMAGDVENAFCAVRPPGHHAEEARAMGFCLFNNVAIAARYLQEQHGLKRIFIIDWDVHHGNGTQNAFYDDGAIYYISIHQHPLYPGTGRVEECGVGEGAGTNLNILMPPGMADRTYVESLQKQVVPAVRGFDPDFILISAGFDAHRDDPLASMEVTERGFAEMTRIMKELANQCCSGRLVSLLEGGYNLDALSKSVELHLRELSE